MVMYRIAHAVHVAVRTPFWVALLSLHALSIFVASGGTRCFLLFWYFLCCSPASNSFSKKPKDMVAFHCGLYTHRTVLCVFTKGGGEVHSKYFIHDSHREPEVETSQSHPGCGPSGSGLGSVGGKALFPWCTVSLAARTVSVTGT